MLYFVYTVYYSDQTSQMTEHETEELAREYMRNEEGGYSRLFHGEDLGD